MLILGLGNPILGDDAVGLHVLREARDLYRRRQDAGGRGRPPSFLEHTAGGIDLLFEVEGHEELILTDAYQDSEGVPGRVRVLQMTTPGAPDRGAAGGPLHAGACPAHRLGLASIMSLGQRLGCRVPRRITAVAVDVDLRLGPVFGEHLSPAVQAAVRPAAEAICNLIRDAEGRAGDPPQTFGRDTGAHQ